MRGLIAHRFSGRGGFLHKRGVLLRDLIHLQIFTTPAAVW
jgi:hypothetical protein